MVLSSEADHMSISRSDSQRILIPIPHLNLGGYQLDSYAWISLPKQAFCASAKSILLDWKSWILNFKWILHHWYGAGSSKLCHRRCSQFLSQSCQGRHSSVLWRGSGEEPISCVSITLRARSHKWPRYSWCCAISLIFSPEKIFVGLSYSKILGLPTSNNLCAITGEKLLKACWALYLRLLKISLTYLFNFFSAVSCYILFAQTWTLPRELGPWY